MSNEVDDGNVAKNKNQEEVKNTKKPMLSLTLSILVLCMFIF